MSQILESKLASEVDAERALRIKALSTQARKIAIRLEKSLVKCVNAYVKKHDHIQYPISVVMHMPEECKDSISEYGEIERAVNQNVHYYTKSNCVGEMVMKTLTKHGYTVFCITTASRSYSYIFLYSKDIKKADRSEDSLE
jgi:hypothetical protein